MSKSFNKIISALVQFRCNKTFENNASIIHCMYSSQRRLFAHFKSFFQNAQSNKGNWITAMLF